MLKCCVLKLENRCYTPTDRTTGTGVYGKMKLATEKQNNKLYAWLYPAVCFRGEYETVRGDDRVAEGHESRREAPSGGGA